MPRQVLHEQIMVVDVAVPPDFFGTIDAADPQLRFQTGEVFRQDHIVLKNISIVVNDETVIEQRRRTRHGQVLDLYWHASLPELFYHTGQYAEFVSEDIDGCIAPVYKVSRQKIEFLIPFVYVLKKAFGQVRDIFRGNKDIGPDIRQFYERLYITRTLVRVWTEPYFYVGMGFQKTVNLFVDENAVAGNSEPACCCHAFRDSYRFLDDRKIEEGLSSEEFNIEIGCAEKRKVCCEGFPGKEC